MHFFFPPDHLEISNTSAFFPLLRGGGKTDPISAPPSHREAEPGGGRWDGAESASTHSTAVQGWHSTNGPFSERL